MRGMFVSGCGAAQFASRQTVDALRACAAEPSAVVLDATDPANRTEASSHGHER